jgi:hypothetical protein
VMKMEEKELQISFRDTEGSLKTMHTQRKGKNYPHRGKDTLIDPNKPQKPLYQNGNYSDVPLRNVSFTNERNVERNMQERNVSFIKESSIEERNVSFIKERNVSFIKERNVSFINRKECVLY